MYSIHATKKLLDRLKTPVTPPVVASTALGNWYATAMLWRPQVAMFLNETTFFPVFVALAPASSLLRRFPAAVGNALDSMGIDPRFVAAEVEAMSEGAVAKTADRRVLGVMNELVFQAEVRAAHDFDVSDLTALSIDVARVLLTPLFKERGGHGSPDATVKAFITELMA